ncbi:AAA family ATPase [Nonomuraea sp. NPDC049400]|uniref:AAA family ATPase n=1 Tax=Nonomuraea sp. NPDC049400 TaxID=3364352 RepID=UPI0037BE1557
MSDSSGTAAGGAIVVVTAMALSRKARARLSEMLGPGFVVVDILRAPPTANVVLAPSVTRSAVSSLRGMFPGARIVVAEFDDDELDIHYSGPVTRAVLSGADGYFVAPSLAGISMAIEGQARLQLTGDVQASGLQITASADAIEPVPPAVDTSPTTAADMPEDDGSGSSIVWLNGPPGVGKTTVATLLAQHRPTVHLLDPEEVGCMLRRVAADPVEKLHEWSAWRTLVAETAIQLLRHQGTGDLMVPIGLHEQLGALDMFVHVSAEKITQRHVLLHCERAVLEERIRGDAEDPSLVASRLEQVDRYELTGTWLSRTAEVVDTTALSPAETVREVLALLHAPERPL